MNSLVYSRSELDEFVERGLPDLLPDEVYFLSLSARKKYLSDAERELYQLGRTEMFCRTVVPSKATFVAHLEEMIAAGERRRTRAGKLFPLHSSVVYVNINPSNMAKAWFDLQREMADVVEAGFWNKDHGGFLNLERRLKNCVQRATRTRLWLDLDFDGPKELAGEVLANLKTEAIDHVKITTRGGCHVLVNRAALNGSGYLLHKDVEKANARARAAGGEVVFNSNGMVPLPGTRQAGYPVYAEYF